METSSPSVKEEEGFPARNTWSGQVDSESFAQVVKKSERKKKLLKTKEGFPASKGLSNVLHKINWNNVRLYVWPRGKGRGTRKTQQKGIEENDLFVSTNRKGGTNDL